LPRLGFRQRHGDARNAVGQLIALGDDLPYGRALGTRGVDAKPGGSERHSQRHRQRRYRRSRLHRVYPPIRPLRRAYAAAGLDESGSRAGASLP
jgi:hypothetical protein